MSSENRNHDDKCIILGTHSELRGGEMFDLLSHGRGFRRHDRQRQAEQQRQQRGGGGSLGHYDGGLEKEEFNTLRTEDKTLLNVLMRRGTFA